MINFKNFSKIKLNLKELKIKANELLSLSTNLIFGKTKTTKIRTNFLIKKEKGYYVLDIVKTAKALCLAQNILSFMLKHKKKILFVNTNSQFSTLFFKNFENFKTENCFYLVSGWIGGLITNWKNFKNKLNSMKELKQIKSTLLKKEQIICAKKIEKFEKNFKGIKNLNGLPDLIVFFSIKNENLATNECKKYAIPTIGFTNFITDSLNYTIPIAININSYYCMQYIFKQLLNPALNK